MSCKDTSELLPAAVLGDLSLDQQRSVHAHLAGCDQCLEEEHELLQTMHLLRSHAEIEPGAGVHASVMSRAAHNATAGRMRLLTQTLLTAAATALLVVGLQSLLESRIRGPVASSPGIHQERSAPALLEGTLFDRQRNVPQDVRRFKQQWRRGDNPRTLDL